MEWNLEVRGIDLGFGGRVFHVAGNINWRWICFTKLADIGGNPN
jgi:hypothetical protein